MLHFPTFMVFFGAVLISFDLLAFCLHIYANILGFPFNRGLLHLITVFIKFFGSLLCWFQTLRKAGYKSLKEIKRALTRAGQMGLCPRVPQFRGAKWSQHNACQMPKPLASSSYCQLLFTYGILLIQSPFPHSQVTDKPCLTGPCWQLCAPRQSIMWEENAGWPGASQWSQDWRAKGKAEIVCCLLERRRVSTPIQREEWLEGAELC